MKYWAFYLAALALHLLVLFGLKAPLSSITPPQSKKYLEVTLAVPPLAPASPPPASAPPLPGPATPPPVAVAPPPPPPPPPVMEIPPPEPTPPPPPVAPAPPSLRPLEVPAVQIALATPVSTVVPSGPYTAPGGKVTPAPAGDSDAGKHLGTITQWSVFEGGNGHYYEAVCVPSGIYWSDAQRYAVTRGGYLATITSAAENAFVFSLIDDPRFWTNTTDISISQGPWLGGFKSPLSPRADAGWQWVHGEGAVSYTNWDIKQPDNAGGMQNHISFFTGKDNSRAPTWDDTNDATALHGFVVEYDSDPLKLPYNPTASANFTDAYTPPPPPSFAKH